MSDTRADVDFTGIAPISLTFDIDDDTITYDKIKVGGSDGVGLAVELTGDHEVGLVSDNGVVLGKLIKVEADKKCTVQVGGAMKLPQGTSATVSVGNQVKGDLLVSAKGYVQNAAMGDGRGLILDATNQDDAEEIVVWF
jgi:hypothetical protein